MPEPGPTHDGEFIGKDDPEFSRNAAGDTVVVPNGFILDEATGELRPAIAAAQNDSQALGQQKLRDLAYKLAAEGSTPLEFLVTQMRDGTAPLSVRLFCAEKAAPYIHKKMPTHIEAKIEDNSGKTGAREKLMQMLEKKMLQQGSSDDRSVD